MRFQLHPESSPLSLEQAPSFEASQAKATLNRTEGRYRAHRLPERQHPQAKQRQRAADRFRMLPWRYTDNGGGQGDTFGAEDRKVIAELGCFEGPDVQPYTPHRAATAPKPMARRLNGPHRQSSGREPWRRLANKAMQLSSGEISISGTPQNVTGFGQQPHPYSCRSPSVHFTKGA